MEMSGSKARLPSPCSVCGPAPSSTLLLQVPGIYHSKYIHYVFSKAGRQEAGRNFSLSLRSIGRCRGKGGRGEADPRQQSGGGRSKDDELGGTCVGLSCMDKREV